MVSRVRPNNGMTMIEVMVVLAIAAVLAAMVVPVFSAVQFRQHMGACASNLKTIGQALLMYRSDHLGFPPDATEWWVAPNPPAPGQHGLGLAQLYYAYWIYEQASPSDYEFYVVAPANYITEVRALHCPRAPADRPDFASWRPVLKTSGQTYEPSPYLGGYNTYDWNYRRDRSSVWPEQGARNLMEPFPPDNTVVTWCPMHRDNAPQAVDELGDVNSRDWDLVLWADGSVGRLSSRFDQYKAEQP